MVPTVGEWFSHGPVDDFLMGQYIGLHTTNTPRIAVYVRNMFDEQSQRKIARIISFSLTMVPTIGGWFSHGPVDGFLIDRWMVFSWTNTLVFTLQMHHV